MKSILKVLLLGGVILLSGCNSITHHSLETKFLGKSKKFLYYEKGNPTSTHKLDDSEQMLVYRNDRHISVNGISGWTHCEVRFVLDENEEIINISLDGNDC